jgi:(p)ppGpp synthase/HD superfamily hydrolase
VKAFEIKLIKSNLMDINMNIVTNMETLARKWHEGQFRKGPKHLPYIVHPEAVVKQLKSWGYSDELDPIVLAIGWGHDLFEDTAVTVQEVMEACGSTGQEVVSGIKWLTFNQSDWSEAKSKEKAKAMYIANVANNAPIDILAVKLADRLCNIRDFIELHGEGSEKVKSYYQKAELLFNNIKRLPEKLQRAVSQTLEDVKCSMEFPEPYELRDE